MLSNEARNLMVKTYEQMPDAVKVGEIFSVSASSVYRLVRQMRTTGSVELRTSSRGRKAALSEQDIENIRLAIESQPDITIHEIRESLNLPVSDETVRAKVVEMGFRRKKNIPRQGTGTSRCQTGTGILEALAVGDVAANREETGISG